MDWNVLPIINLIMLIMTILSVGLSLVEVQPRQHKNKIAIISLLVVITWLGFGWLVNVELPVPIMYIMLLLFISLYLKLPLLQAIMAVLFGMLYHFLIVELLENNLFDLILSSSGVKVDSFITFVIALFTFMINVLVVMFIYQKEPVLIKDNLFHMEMKSDKQMINFKPHLLFSVLILFFMNLFLYYTYVERASLTTNYRMIITFWSIFMCGLILFFLRIILAHKMEQAAIYRDKQYQKDLLSFYSVIRTQRHDFNFHLNSIFGLIQREEFALCMDYIKEIVANAQRINELLPLKHPAISALLHTQSEIAKSKGIRLHFSIYDDLKDMPCSVYDMNKILGNLIQNAIDEVEEHPRENRVIEVEISKLREHISIKVKNSTALTLEQLENLFTNGYTTKVSHEGIGLAGIERIVTNYQGIIYPELSDATITVHVRMPLKE